MADEWSRDTSDQTNVTLEVDLVELFDGQLVPDSPKLREAIGQEIIDIIRERTQDKQRSWTGSSFRKYSDEYVESVDFKAYGKEKSEPNLTQTGDMLGLLTVLDSDPAKVKIGWDDTLQSEKAHGHITGNVGTKRDFLGLTSEEIRRVKSKFQDELPEAPRSTRNPVEQSQNFLSGRMSIGQRSLSQVIDLFFGEDE